MKHQVLVIDYVNAKGKARKKKDESSCFNPASCYQFQNYPTSPGPIEMSASRSRQDVSIPYPALDTY